LSQQIKEAFHQAEVSLSQVAVTSDPDDLDQQTLLISYPSVVNKANDYLRPTIKIEAGAKSALDPHHYARIEPYVAREMANANLGINNVVTIDAERTFWDKVVILHGLRRWYDHRGQLRHQGHRISRHYYDIYQLLQSEVGQRALNDSGLAVDCVRHAQMFFNSADLDLGSAQPGSFAIVPTSEMQAVLKRDYQAMADMIFGEVPEFPTVMGEVTKLEQQINQVQKSFFYEHTISTAAAFFKASSTKSLNATAATVTSTIWSTK
jgi:hypothetical protein